MRSCLLLLAALSITLLTSCGGGGGESSESKSTPIFRGVDGYAQKGPLLRGAWVTVNELRGGTLTPSGVSYGYATVDNNGTFLASTTQFTAPLLELAAIGYYFDEISGNNSKDMVILRALADVSQDRALNVNTLTHLTAGRIKSTVSANQGATFTAARQQAQRDLLRAFYIYNAADLLPGGEVGPGAFTGSMPFRVETNTVI